MDQKNCNQKNSDKMNSNQKDLSQRDLSQNYSLLKEIDFYLVTDSGLSKKGTLSDVKEAVEAGCRFS